MKHISKSSLLLALAAGLASGQASHPGFTRTALSFTPSNLFTPQSTSASLPLVGGMDFFPDGRIALLEWGVPGSVFIISADAATGTSGVGITRFARGMNSAMGLRVVDNTIYVMEKEGLTQLVDTDKNGVADEYNCINQGFPSNNSMLNLSYDLGYSGGKFYAAISSDVAAGGYDFGSSQKPGTTALAGRSTMYQMSPDGSSSAFACGFRNPNGMEVNGEDIFVSDNEGSWMPSSKLIHVKQGRFYGHRTNPANACQTANNNTESPPVVWSTFGDGTTATGRSWGSPTLVRSGPYKGQFLIGETVMNSPNNVVRVFVEKVGGELQGVVLPFIEAGSTKGVQRILERNGTIFLGIHGSTGGWGARSGMVPGFDVLRPNTAANFLEVKAVRSMGPGSFEVEFNKNVGSGAGQAAQYTVSTWQNIAVENYGGGRFTDRTNLTVSSAGVSADKRKVTLNIGGLKAGWVVKINFGSGISGEDASSLHTDFAVYTLNKFGPGADYEAIPVGVESPRVSAEAGWRVVRGNGFHLLRFSGNPSVQRDVALHDIQGAKRRELLRISGSEVRLETGDLAKGMYLVRVTERGKTTMRHLLVP
jgi:cytochrome c